jgi:hypothetical protein
VTKAELVDHVAATVQLPKHQIDTVLTQFLQGIMDALQAGDKVELLIDRVIVNDTQVEIRYVVPTGPKGETTPFCHLCLDYLDLETCGV